VTYAYLLDNTITEERGDLPDTAARLDNDEIAASDAWLLYRVELNGAVSLVRFCTQSLE
jgi:hypothetical protein